MSQFTHKGQSQKEIEELCDLKNLNQGPARWNYWDSELYSFGRIYREFGYYPTFFPLHFSSVHGVNSDADIDKREVENDAPLMFYFTPRVVEKFKKLSDNPCYSVIAPYAWYRRHHNIKQTPDAKGTLCFLDHSVPQYTVTPNYDAYFEKLKALPEKYQPVCLCIHMHDVNHGLHKKILEAAIPLYTAGNTSDFRFVDRFYDILKNFKYTISSRLGSHLYYSVDMGIPFSLYGDDTDWMIINGETGLPYEMSRSMDVLADHHEVRKKFSIMTDTVTLEQKEFVEKVLGVHTSISRTQFTKLIWTAWWHCGDKKEAFHAVRRKIKHFFRKYFRRIF